VIVSVISLVISLTIVEGGTIPVAVEVIPCTLVVVIVEPSTSVSVKVMDSVLVPTIVVCFNVEVNKELEKLVLSPPVVPDITEVSVNDSRMVVTLRIVELSTVMFLVDTTKVVDFSTVFDNGGVEVNVVVKVITVGAVPQPEGIIEGPPGRQEARPGY
jgi:hypothetical protein